MSKTVRNHGAVIAISAVAALAGAGVIKNYRRGSRSLSRKIKWNPRMCVITAEILFEDYNAEEDRDKAISEGRTLTEDLHGMFSPGPFEYIAFGKRKVRTAKYHGDIDQEALSGFFLSAANKLKEQLGSKEFRTGSFDDVGNLDVIIYDTDAPSIIRMIHELDLAKSERTDAEDLELEPAPYFRARDWRFYPEGFTDISFISIHKIEVIGDNLYMKAEED